MTTKKCRQDQRLASTAETREFARQKDAATWAINRQTAALPPLGSASGESGTKAHIQQYYVAEMQKQRLRERIPVMLSEAPFDMPDEAAAARDCGCGRCSRCRAQREAACDAEARAVAEKISE